LYKSKKLHLSPCFYFAFVLDKVCFIESIAGSLQCLHNEELFCHALLGRL